jgi:hypothetical protein
MSIDDLLDKLANAERNFEGTEFLAPIIGTNRVQVRVAGIICQLAIVKNLPPKYHGWGILRALSTKKATFERQASLAEIGAYLRLFPAVRLILLRQRKHYWLAMPAHRGDSRFRIQGPVSLWLPEEGLQRFETVLAGFDGRLFWYRDRDSSRDPALAAYLREQIIRQEDKGLPPLPETLHKRGLSAEERNAYALAWAILVEEQRDRVEVRLSEALAHAGAELRDYSERGDTYIVSYVIDGRSHVSTIQQDDLSVMTAGICLAGRDRHFDLASLVGVLREAEQRNLVWVDPDHLPEDQYWQIHPPDNP